MNLLWERTPEIVTDLAEDKRNAYFMTLLIELGPRTYDVMQKDWERMIEAKYGWSPSSISSSTQEVTEQ